MTLSTRSRERTLVTEGNPDERYRVPLNVNQGAWWDAPDVQIIALALIEKKFPAFPECTIRYLWKEKGGAKNGNATLGTCKKVGDTSDLGYFSQCDYIIWLAADHVIGMELDHYQVEALIYHELCHVTKEDNEDGDGPLSIKGHDFEGFVGEIAEYGFWLHDVQAIAQVVQMRLALGEDTAIENPTTRVAMAALTNITSRRRRKAAEAAQEPTEGEPSDLPEVPDVLDQVREHLSEIPGADITLEEPE